MNTCRITNNKPRSILQQSINKGLTQWLSRAHKLSRPENAALEFCSSILHHESPFAGICLCLIHPEMRDLSGFRFYCDKESRLPQKEKLPDAGETLCRKCYNRKKSIFGNCPCGPSECPCSKFLKGKDIKSIISVPVVLNDKPLGTLTFMSPLAVKPSKDELVAIKNTASNFIAVFYNLVSAEKTENENLRHILDSACDGTWKWNLKSGKLQLDNRAAGLLAPWLSEIKKEIEWKDLLSPDEITFFNSVKKEHLEGRKDFFDYVLNKNDAASEKDKYILARGKFTQGKQTIVGYFEEITDKMKLYEFQEKADFRQMLINSMPLPIAYKNPSGKYIGCNKAFESLAKITGSQINGKTDRDIFPIKFADENRKQEKQAFREEQVNTRESCVKFPDRKEQYLLGIKSVFYNENKNKAGTISSWINITERKLKEAKLNRQSLELKQKIITKNKDLEKTNRELRKEIKEREKIHKALKESEKRYKILTETIQVGTWQLDPQGMITYLNPKMAEILNEKKPEKLLGHSFDKYIPNDSIKSLEFETLDNEKGFRSSYEAKIRNGPEWEKDVIVAGVGIFSPDGKFKHYVETFTDMTDHIKAKIKAEKQKQQLIQADKMVSLGTLVASVAHEINNPVHFMMLNISIIKEAWKSICPILEEYYEKNGEFSAGGLPYSKMKNMLIPLIDGIIEGGERIQNIVAGLKDYARKDNESEPKQKINIITPAEKAVNLLSNVIKKSTSNFEIKHKDKELYFMGNCIKIEQVFVNLIQNACQALEKSSQGIFISTEKDPENNILIKVRDEGKGIPAKYRKQLFNPFFSTKTQTGGTGLGLSITAGIVKEHKGKIKIASTTGKGTTVEITIPGIDTSPNP